MEKTEPPYQAKCIECGKLFTGRTDKRFCSRKCKNAFNNRHNSNIARYRRETIAALDRNYEILSGLMAIGATSAKLQDICSIGFSPEMACTHKKGENGHSKRSCYDLVYHQTTTKIFNLRKEEPNRAKSPSTPPGKR